MSIINAIIHPECAYLCADTEAGPDGGPYAELSKLLPLPHLNAVVAFRGSLMLFASAVAALVSAPYDFDELAERIPSLLKLVADKAIEVSRQLPEPLAPGGVEMLGCGELILAGFSPKRSMIVGHHFRRDALDADFLGGETIVSVAPYWRDVDLGVSGLKAQPGKEVMKALALKQLRIIRERERAGVAAGGRLIYAEVRPSGIAVECVLNFPQRPQG